MLNKLNFRFVNSLVLCVFIISFFLFQNCRKNQNNLEVVKIPDTINNPKGNSDTEDDGSNNYSQYFITSSNDILFRGVKQASQIDPKTGVQSERPLRILSSDDNAVTWKEQTDFVFPETKGWSNINTEFNFSYVAKNYLFVGATRTGTVKGISKTLSYIFKTKTNARFPKDIYIWEYQAYLPTNDIRGFVDMSTKPTTKDEFVVVSKHDNNQILRTPNYLVRVLNSTLSSLNDRLLESNFTSKYFYSESDVPAIEKNYFYNFYSITHNSLAYATVGSKILFSDYTSILEQISNNTLDIIKDKDYIDSKFTSVVQVSNDGINWSTVIHNLPNKGLQTIRTDLRNTFISDQEGRIYKSTNTNFSQWKKVYEASSRNFSYNYFVFDTHLNIYYALGNTKNYELSVESNNKSSLSLIVSKDYGENWEEVYKQENAFASGLELHNGKVFFIGGELLPNSQIGITPFIRSLNSK